MLNQGVPIIIVSRRLGQSKESVTLDIYDHLMAEAQDDVAELIDDLITPVETELHLNCTLNPTDQNQPFLVPLNKGKSP